MRAVNVALAIMFGALLLCVVTAESVSAQNLKIGFVRDDRFATDFPEFTRAQEQWETERKQWETEAQTKEQEYQEMLADYEKQSLILSDEKKKEREDAIRLKRDSLDAYTRQIYGPGGLAERRNAELTEPIITKINKAIELVATEGSYDVIFTLQSIGYIKEQYDVTDQVLAKLNEIE